MMSVMKMTGMDLMMGKTSLNPLDGLASNFLAAGVFDSSRRKNNVATASNK